MICVYRAYHPIEAHLCHHWLRRNGIAAEVRGDLMTARGELPVAESSPTVWVAPEDAADAELLVAEFERAGKLGEVWTCPFCGEKNDMSFGSCWNCSNDHPDFA